MFNFKTVDDVYLQTQCFFEWHISDFSKIYSPLRPLLLRLRLRLPSAPRRRAAATSTPRVR